MGNFFSGGITCPDGSRLDCTNPQKDYQKQVIKLKEAENELERIKTQMKLNIRNETEIIREKYKSLMKNQKEVIKAQKTAKTKAKEYLQNRVKAEKVHQSGNIKRSASIEAGEEAATAASRRTRSMIRKI